MSRHGSDGSSGDAGGPSTWSDAMFLNNGGTTSTTAPPITSAPEELASTDVRVESTTAAPAAGATANANVTSSTEE